MFYVVIIFVDEDVDGLRGPIRDLERHDNNFIAFVYKVCRSSIDPNKT
jgi:hypothetical protein